MWAIKPISSPTIPWAMFPVPCKYPRRECFLPILWQAKQANCTKYFQRWQQERGVRR
jgi:hypothetical protein